MPDMIQLARELRKTSTDAERKLWAHLRLRQLAGIKFRRQQPVGSYIIDFISFEKRLILELEGGQHAAEKEKDQLRTDWLRDQGFIVLRFWNNEVLQNIEGVLEQIQRHCKSPSPAPPLKGGGHRKTKQVRSEEP